MRGDQYPPDQCAPHRLNGVGASVAEPGSGHGAARCPKKRPWSANRRRTGVALAHRRVRPSSLTRPAARTPSLRHKIIDAGSSPRLEYWYRAGIWTSRRLNRMDLVAADDSSANEKFDMDVSPEGMTQGDDDSEWVSLVQPIGGANGGIVNSPIIVKAQGILHYEATPGMASAGSSMSDTDTFKIIHKNDVTVAILRIDASKWEAVCLSEGEFTY